MMNYLNDFVFYRLDQPGLSVVDPLKTQCDQGSIQIFLLSVEGITVEQYIIRQKIEKAKELLFYDELNLSQIANRLGYSSVAHLSAQFKKVTGLTPSEMKKTRDLDHNRKPLDSIV